MYVKISSLSDLESLWKTLFDRVKVRVRAGASALGVS